MLENAYVCPHCIADLKGDLIPPTSKPYYEGAEYFTKAIELINVGYEHEECGCRWKYNGEIFKDGIEELRDKYKIQDTTEIIESIDDENQDEQIDTLNQENNKSIEDK